MRIAYIYKHANNIFTTPRKDASKTDLQSGEVIEFAMYLADIYDEVRIVSQDRDEIEHYTDKVKIGHFATATEDATTFEGFLEHDLSDRDLYYVNSIEDTSRDMTKHLWQNIVYVVNDLRLIDERILHAADAILTQAYDLHTYYPEIPKKKFFKAALEILAMRHHFIAHNGVGYDTVNSDNCSGKICAVAMNIEDYNDERRAQLQIASDLYSVEVIGKESSLLRNLVFKPTKKWSLLPNFMARYMFGLAIFSKEQIETDLMPNRIIESLCIAQVPVALYDNKYGVCKITNVPTLMNMSRSVQNGEVDRVKQAVVKARHYDWYMTMGERNITIREYGTSFIFDQAPISLSRRLTHFVKQLKTKQPDYDTSAS